VGGAHNLRVVAQRAAGEVRLIHGLGYQDTLASCKLTVLVRDGDQSRNGAMGWIGRGWLHIDAVAQHLPDETIVRVLTALETAAAHQGCRFSQMEVSLLSLRSVLERHLYVPVQTFVVGGYQWVVLRKELVRTQDHERLASIQETLTARAGHLTAPDAAALLHLSASHFRHQFKRALGMSFRAARLDAKLAHAVHLLRTTSQSIPEIAAALGYSDRTKLEKSFKRAFGVTPAAYRRQG